METANLGNEHVWGIYSQPGLELLPCIVAKERTQTFKSLAITLTIHPLLSKETDLVNKIILVLVHVRHIPLISSLSLYLLNQ